MMVTLGGRGHGNWLHRVHVEVELPEANSASSSNGCTLPDFTTILTVL